MSSVQTPRRTRQRRAVVVLAAAAALLTGCSSVDLNPGRAAVVNDDFTVSASSVDDTVTAACNYIEIQAKNDPQNSQAIALSDLRSSFTTTEILVPLYEQLTDELGLTIRPADVEKLAGQNTLPDGLSEKDQEILTDYFHDVAVLNLSQALIGSHTVDPSVTDSSQLTTDESASGADTITAFLEKQDVEVNPQYGTWQGTSVAFESGSLSTPVSESGTPLVADPQTGVKDVSQLPPTQVCGG